MADFNLNVLLHELPDPRNELFVQVDLSLNTPKFRLFPRLPAEIRLLVWNYTFEPRSVNLNHCKENYRPDTAFEEKPKALVINNESRSEALKYYQPIKNPISECSFAVDFHRHRTIYIYPAIDFVYMDLQGLAISTVQVYTYMQELRIQNTELFDSIERLEIRGCGNVFGGQRAMHLMISINLHLGRGLLPGPAMMFANLKTIYIKYEDYNGVENLRGKGREEARVGRDTLKRMLMLYKLTSGIPLSARSPKLVVAPLL